MTTRVGPVQVGVVGAGTMGVGIVLVMLSAGHKVVVQDVDEASVARGIDQVRRFLDRSLSKGKLTEVGHDDALNRLTGTVDLGDLGGSQVVVEAIYEDATLKADLFGKLDDVCGPDTLFHTNTSTLSVTAIAAGSRYPQRVVGTHYCNPAPLMKLVEVVRGRRTDDDALAATVHFVEGLGKRVVLTGDTPGFLVNLFLIPFENDCLRALEAGLGTIESIDLAVKAGLGYPLGTFELLDIVGLDIHRSVSLSLFDQLRDPRFAPPPLVDRMISAGQLGRKTREGFYTYKTNALFGG